MLCGRCAAGACHTGGTDSEAHLGLGLLNHVIDVPDHHVDVVAAPVGKRHVHAGVVPQIIVLGRAVGGNVLGIEVVVKDNTVHIIFSNDFPDDIHDALTSGGQARIEDGLGVVGQKHSRVLQLLVLRGVPVGARAPAIRVHPSVALDAAHVALLNGILQGIVSGIFASCACQVT